MVHNQCARKIFLFPPSWVNGSPVNWSRLTINLDPATAKAAKEIARKQKRSFAAYVATLIEKDMAAGHAAEESPAPYIATAHGPKEKPPDNPSRTTGAGPRHRVSKSA